MRTLIISFIVLTVSLVTPARADLILTAQPFMGFDAGWSFDGGTINMADGFTGTITSANVAIVIVAFNLRFTSPADSYTVSSGFGDTVTMPSGSTASFDGTNLTIPTTDPLASAIFFDRDNGMDLQRIVYSGARINPPVIAGQTLVDSLATPQNFSQSSPAAAPLVLASVPEPSAFFSVGLIGLSLIGVRKRKPLHKTRLPCMEQ